MLLFEITNNENNESYKSLEVSNGSRQYDFMRSIVAASIEMERPFLSQVVIKALNYHAIVCLHAYAGEYRPCEVTVGAYNPPAHFRVQALMDDFVNNVNRYWEEWDAIALAAYILWRINYIHPFINGNGRTARATSYFALCLKSGGWLPGATILPELLRKNREEYVEVLADTDKTFLDGKLDLQPLVNLLSRLLTEQLRSADIPIEQS